MKLLDFTLKGSLPYIGGTCSLTFAQGSVVELPLTFTNVKIKDDVGNIHEAMD